ncbi:MAG TPA: DUF4836 family protein [Bacteroides sp.]|nr:DUF4836 family protein [Bacteroides sp.]
MKTHLIIMMLAAGLFLTSCGKKAPDFVNSIPEDAVAVVSLHPMEIYRKGQLNTLQNLKEKVRGKVWEQVLEDPLSSGLQMDQYSFVFIRMKEEAPVIGVVTGMKDTEKFESLLKKIDEEVGEHFVKTDDYTYARPDKEGIIGWNKERMIVLATPDEDEFETAFLTATLDSMFHPVKETSITSMVDFRDFMGDMKDLNVWVSSRDLRKLVEKAMKNDSVQFDLPVDLSNNYARAYCEFEDGKMLVTAETRFSEEVKKNLEEVLVMKPSLNKSMLEMAPAGDLLLAVAGSMDLNKLQKIVKRLPAGELGETGNKVEQMTGLPPEELLEALTGDFVISVNGISQQNMIPLELFVGLGVKNDVLQEKLMEKVGGTVPVDRQQDFFIINIQGNEIYSGITDQIWVVTNARGYRTAMTEGKIEKPLTDSRFKDFSGGSVGMYMNLDASAYPASVTSMFSQNPKQKKWLDYMAESFRYLGVTAGNYEGNAILETSKQNENSLYTILKMTDLNE